MSSIILRAGLLGGLIATTSWLPATSPAHGQTTTADALRGYVEVWNTGEVDRLDDLLTEDFRRHGGYGTAESRQEMRRVIENSRGFYQDLHVELDDVMANPDKGAMRWRFTGSWGTTRFELDSVHFSMIHFRDGKISEEWVLGNYMNLFRTFGYRLVPPQARIVPPEVEASPGPGLAERLRHRGPELDAHALATRDLDPDDAGDVTIAASVACELVLDGRHVGWLAPGSEVLLTLARGRRRLEAISPGGSVFFERSFTARPGRAVEIAIEAPGRVIADAKNGTVEDLTTGLMWQAEDNGRNATLSAAEARCRDLEQAGYDDWRLPSIHELQSLHSPESPHRYRTIEAVELSDCCPWTSTPHGDFYWTYAFAMDMRYLQHESLGYHMRVLCVRDAAAAPTPAR